ncbi:MAG TPA: NF038120 family PEP-CTERM protein [Burkholderiaceae bacterium]|jgi:hypothetical protein
MKSFWTKSVLAVASLVCATAVHASTVTSTIDFENVDTTNAPFAPLMVDRDYVTQGGYFVNTQDYYQGGGLIAQLSNGADPGSCLNTSCPNNSTNFLSVYNDGIVHIGRLDGQAGFFDSLSVAFLQTPGFAGSIYFVVEADRSDNTSVAYAYSLGTNGAFKTITASTPGLLLGGSGGLDSPGLTDLFLYAYYCPAGGNCNAFNSDKAQFALDDVTLSVIPEPSAFLLVFTALGALGYTRKIARRRSV